MQQQDEVPVCGRSKEVKQILDFISTKIHSRTSGVLYLAGPPGTGKSMSIQLAIDRFKELPKLNFNCARIQSSKAILTKMCQSFDLKKYARCNESEMTSRLTKKLVGRSCQPVLIVLDEIDQLPKSKNIDLVRAIFGWPSLPDSKLILVGIANTVNLTARYQSISHLLGRDDDHVVKIIFRPYTKSDIRAILHWYLENDENFEDSAVDQKAIEMIAVKYARESGDIRGAINALRSCVDDTRPITPPVCSSSQHGNDLNQSYPTPPATPPPSPCKEKTNLASVANSIKKRQRTTNYIDDLFPFTHQVILACVFKLSSGKLDSTVDLKACNQLVQKVLKKFGVSTDEDDRRAIVDILEMQGLIGIKRARPKDKIVLKISENELDDLVVRKQMILDSIK